LLYSFWKGRVFVMDDVETRRSSSRIGSSFVFIPIIRYGKGFVSGYVCVSHRQSVSQSVPEPFYRRQLRQTAPAVLYCTVPTHHPSAIGDEDEQWFASHTQCLGGCTARQYCCHQSKHGEKKDDTNNTQRHTNIESSRRSHVFLTIHSHTGPP